MILQKVLITSSSNPISGLAVSNKNPKLRIIETHGGIIGNINDVASKSTDLINYCFKNNISYLTYNPSNNGSQKNEPLNQVLFSRRIDDLNNVMSYAKDKFNCPIILLGTSLGGLISINATAQGPQKISGLIINCGVIDPEDTIKRIVKEKEFEEWQSKDTLNVFNVNLPYLFFRDIKNLNAEEILKHLTIPAIWFHGENDEIVPIKQIVGIASLNNKINLIKIKNGRHRFGNAMQPGEWEQKTEAFIETLLN